MSTSGTVTPLLEIRPFPISDATILKSVNDAIAALPPGGRGALIAYADTDGARVGVVANLGHGWSFVGHVGGEYKGKLVADASLVFQW